MYHLEIITPDEMLVYSQDFNDKIEMMISYNKIINNLNTRNQYHGNQIQLFGGVDYENMHELTEYRTDL